MMASITPAVPLNNLTSSGTPTVLQPTTSQNTSRPNRAPAHPAVPGNVLAASQPTSNTQSPSTGQRPSRPSNNAAASQVPTRRAVLRFLLATWVGNLIAALALVVAILALGLSAYSSAIQAIVAKWSAKNDALQSCIAASAVDIFSTYCNETISAGVKRPPIVRRTMQSSLLSAASTGGYQSLTIAWVCVVTVAAGVYAIVYSRPQMRPFRPVVSAVRIPPLIVQLADGVKEYWGLSSVDSICMDMPSTGCSAGASSLGTAQVTEVSMLSTTETDTTVDATVSTVQSRPSSPDSEFSDKAMSVNDERVLQQLKLDRDTTTSDRGSRPSSPDSELLEKVLVVNDESVLQQLELDETDSSLGAKAVILTPTSLCLFSDSNYDSNYGVEVARRVQTAREGACLGTSKSSLNPSHGILHWLSGVEPADAVESEHSDSNLVISEKLASSNGVEPPQRQVRDWMSRVEPEHLSHSVGRTTSHPGFRTAKSWQAVDYSAHP